MSDKLSVNKLSLTGSLVCGMLILLTSGSLFADRIAGGDTHNLAANGNGAQFVWGGNANGQLGDGTTLDALNPIAVVDIRYQALDGAIAVVAHGDNNLVLLDDATLLGWGPNESGQLGSGLLYSGRFLGDSEEDTDDTDDGTDPEPVSTALSYPTEVVDPDGKPIANITAIALGANFAAAVNQEGSVLVWGNLDDFQDREDQREPVNRFRDKFFDPTIEFIDSKYKDGNPAQNFDLQYMSDASGSRYTNIVAVAVGDNHLLALNNVGQVLAWGENSSGQMGDGTLTQRAYPVFVRNAQLLAISNIGDIAARGTTSMAVSNDGRLLGWGDAAVVSVASIDVADDEDTEESSVSIATSVEGSYADPLLDNSGNPITGLQSIAPGDSHMLGLTKSGRVQAWGSNSNGQLGDGTNSSVTGTANVILGNGQDIGNIIEIAVGSNHSLALRRDGRVFAWGLGDVGQLGDGTNIDSYYAVNVRDRSNNQFSLF